MGEFTKHIDAVQDMDDCGCMLITAGGMRDKIDEAKKELVTELFPTLEPFPKEQISRMLAYADKEVLFKRLEEVKKRLKKWFGDSK